MVHRDAAHCADFGKLVVLAEEPEDLLISLGGGSHLCYSWVVSSATTFVYTLPTLLTDYTSGIITSKLMSAHKGVSEAMTSASCRSSGSDSPCSHQFRLAKL